MLRGISTSRIEAQANSGGEVEAQARQHAMGHDARIERLRDLGGRPREQVVGPSALRHLWRLNRPDGADPDAFYVEVARAYRMASGGSSKPAVLIAEASEVPWQRRVAGSTRRAAEGIYRRAREGGREHEWTSGRGHEAWRDWSYVVRVTDPETGRSKPKWVGGFPPRCGQGGPR